MNRFWSQYHFDTIVMVRDTTAGGSKSNLLVILLKMYNKNVFVYVSTQELTVMAQEQELKDVIIAKCVGNAKM